MTTTPEARTEALRRLATEAGFARVGVAAAHDRPEDRARLQAWLDAGMHGEMAWLARDVRRRSDVREVVPGARSVIVLTVPYDSDTPRTAQALDAAGAGHGWISRYAWGDDYHDVIDKRLRRLARSVEASIVPDLPVDFRGADMPTTDEAPFDGRRDFRYYVDHGPVLERRWAEEAGVGWQGKHGLIIDPRSGSFFFLALIITTIAFEPDTPATDHCGTCTRCIDACPTDAIVADRVVDARRCISYLTIEQRSALTVEQRAMLHGHVFGCDICQDVCPFNRFSTPSGEAAFEPRAGSVAPSLVDLATLDDAAFRARFRKSPLKRAGREKIGETVAALAVDRGRS